MPPGARLPFVMILMPVGRETPRLLPPDVRAVPAEPYLAAEEAQGNPGGITRAELVDSDIRPLGSFEDGALLYIESDDPTDALDDTDDDSIAATRVWWRARLVER